jgi:periplasmic protein TonB
MLAYAANRPVAGQRPSSPNALLIVISAHVALVAAVMSARMDLPHKLRHDPISIEFIRDPVPPPARPVPPAKPEPQPADQWITHSTPQVPIKPIGDVPMDAGGISVDPGPVAGGGTAIIRELPRPIVEPLREQPRLLTPAAELKPPYPASKLLSGDEAVLTLRLSVDERGRVVAVEPVGRADRDFLAAARRHLMAHWRYRPATEDGRAVESSLTVTLRFELDG